MDMLFLRLPAPGQRELTALSCVAGSWQRLGICREGDDLGVWLAAQRGLPTVLITPAGLDIALTLDATPKQRREAGIALVALAEESLAEDFERLHWVLDSLDEHQVLARGIRRDWLESWMARLADAGLSVKAAIPEAALLSADAENWAWLPSGSEVFLQTAPGQAAMIQPADAVTVLTQLLAQRPMQTPVRLRHPQGSTLPTLPDSVHAAPAPWQDWSDLLRHQPPSEWLKHRANWLTGELAPRSQARYSRVWIGVLALALLVVLVQAGFARWEARQLQQATEQARAEAEAAYRQAFPQDRRIINLERQFAARQQRAGDLAADQILSRLAQTSPGPQWQIQRLDYRGGSTRVEVMGPSQGELQRWLNSLIASGLSARIETSQAADNAIKATLLLQSGAEQGGR